MDLASFSSWAALPSLSSPGFPSYCCASLVGRLLLTYTTGLSRDAGTLTLNIRPLIRWYVAKCHSHIAGIPMLIVYAPRTD
jgi:hypothetical protein